MLDKSDFDKLDERLENITLQPVEEMEINSDLPLTIEELEDNNKTYAIMGAILFIDIRKSTHLMESSQAKSMVKIYRSFMRMAVDCVRKNGGVTRQFLGDRIMGVFIDSIEDDNAVSKAVNKAINAARSLQTVIDFSLNKHLKNNVNGKVIECGIGIDYGKVLLTKVGMYGVEHEKEKESEVSCVWVGNITNYASKYSDIATGGEIFVSEKVYNEMSDKYKDVWIRAKRYQGTKVFSGYIAEDYYLDFSDELGKTVKVEEDKIENLDTSEQLIDGISELEKLIDKLTKREKELAILKDRLTRENQNLIRKYKDANDAKDEVSDERDDAQRELHKRSKEYYNFVCEIISFSHTKTNYIKYVTEEFWMDIIRKCYENGRWLGHSDKEVTRQLDAQLIGIYSYYKKYDKAYEVTLIMAELNSVWIKLDKNTLQWAKDNSKLYLLINEIERRLVNHTVTFDKRGDFQEYLKKIKKIRGF